MGGAASDSLVDRLDGPALGASSAWAVARIVMADMDIELDLATPPPHAHPQGYPHHMMVPPDPAPSPPPPVSSPPTPPPPRYTIVNAAHDALPMLAAVLKPFVIRAVEAAVGEDLAPSYGPRTWDTPSLLAFIKQKWIGTFADTGLGAGGVGGRELVARLTKHVHTLQRSGAGAVAAAAAAGVLADGERLAEAVGDRGGGGRVAALRAAVDVDEKQTPKQGGGAGPRGADLAAAKVQEGRKGSPPRRSRFSSEAVTGGKGGSAQVHVAAGGGRLAQIEAQASAAVSSGGEDSAVEMEMEMEAPESADTGESLVAPTLPASVGLVANGQWTPSGVADGVAVPPLRCVPATANDADASVRARLHVVLDGPNVAWAHGSGCFSYAGILLAECYFRAAGHAVTTFLPASRLPLGGAGGATGEVAAAAAVDATTGMLGLPPPGPDRDCVVMAALHARAGTPALAIVPNGEYDDTYALAWARRKGGVIVSNDAYADMIYQESATSAADRDAYAAWIRACRLPFTWVGDEFLPSPLFDWDRAAAAGAGSR